jgi:hypothetical protein
MIGRGIPTVDREPYSLLLQELLNFQDLLGRRLLASRKPQGPEKACI